MIRTHAFVFLFLAIPGAAWGQRTVQRPAQPAPEIRQTTPTRALRAQPAAPTLAQHELSHVVQQTRPPEGLTRAETRTLRRVSERLRHKDRAVALEQWKHVVRSVTRRNANVDINSLVAYVLRKSYIETNEDLKHHADRIRHFNEQKKAAREHMKELRRQRRELERSDDPTETVTVRRLTLSDNYDDNRRPLQVEPPTEMTVDSVAEELQKIVVLANTAEENEESANVDLQNALQKQQRTQQMMSNISKILHDTAKSVIRNMR